MKCNLKKSKTGLLIWITGLAGSGKTTLAQSVYDQIRDDKSFVLIDGEDFRKIMQNDLGYSNEDRVRNAYRIARMSKFLTDHRINVICSTISLYKEIHEWNRKNIKNYIEVFIDAPIELLIRINKNNLYSKALQNKKKHICQGINQSFDAPENPEIIIKNSSDLKKFLSSTDKILDYINSYKNK